MVIEWDPRLLFRQLLPDEASVDAFLAEIDFHSWNGELDAGLSFAEGLARHKRRFPHHAALLDAFVERWDETIGDEIPGTAAIVEELRAAPLPVFGLTNFSAETWPRALERYPVLRRLDGVVVSGEEGVRKPDRSIFDVLRARFGLDPGRTLFVDDLGVNVEAAVALGYLGHLFTDGRALRATLVNLGALPPAR